MLISHPAQSALRRGVRSPQTTLSVDELVGETLAAIRTLFYERMQAAGSSGGGPKERLIRTLDAFRDFAIDEPRLYDALFLNPGVARIDRSRGQNIFAFVVDRVADCARDGQIRESGPVGSALKLIALVQGLVLLYRQGRFGSKERFSEAYSRSVEDMMGGLS